MTRKTATDETALGIGAVAKLTGLTAHTIRVWERRYRAIVAERGVNGRRIYTTSDAEKLGLLKRLTDEGIRISQIAGNSIDELRGLLRELTPVEAVSAPSQIRTAIFGEYLPSRFRAGQAIGSLQIVASDTSLDRLLADIRRDPVDVMVYETTTLEPATSSRLRELQTLTGVCRIVVVYGYGRRRDVAELRDLAIVTMRSPVSADELRAAVARTYASRNREDAQAVAPAAEPDTGWDIEGNVEPRRFTSQQLARLAATASAVECECPQHLAQLVRDLSGFETYSHQCANRDDDDEALHRYLQHTTASARALIETALEKVVRAEGIDL